MKINEVELKFRAWEKELKEMIPVEDISFELRQINTTSAWRLFEEVELMQYTGFKDKNDKEIYEGDILNREGYWGYYVGFEQGQFVCVPLNNIQKINWKWNPLKDIEINHWEIIGNIYENPEILEGGK